MNLSQLEQEVLEVLTDEPQITTELADQMGLDYRGISYALRQLYRKGLVYRDTMGTRVCWRRRKLQPAEQQGEMLKATLKPMITPEDKQWMAYYKAKWDARQQRLNQQRYLQ